MTASDLPGQAHRRLNVLTGDWVLVSPHRTQRPWQGRTEDLPSATRPAHDPACYLCPGNERAGGVTNPAYSATFAFDNDFPALLEDGPVVAHGDGKLLVARTESGVCRVICFSPRHDLTLAEMDADAILRVVELWTDEYRELGARKGINHVQIFENKGAVMGCSNPHPHGQVWAQKSTPCEPGKELANMQKYFEDRGRPLLIDYVNLELELEERVVCANESFAALVPFWAVWPFEIMVLPRRQASSLLDLSPEERAGFADIIKRVAARYDNLFQVSFPYSSGIHQAPTDGQSYPGCTMHMHFYPPLLRSATIRKFMVGYEMLGEAQRDITAEGAAKLLREQPELHYSRRGEAAAT